MSQFKILLIVFLDFFLAKNVLLKLSFWTPVRFIFCIKELNWEIVLEIHHCSFVKHDVKSIVLAIGPEKQIFRVSAIIEGALEIRMLSVKSQVPGDCVYPLCVVID